MLIKESKFGSGLSERFETIFLRHVGHSLLPRINAVVIQSEQKRCRHSFVVIVLVNKSKQIGQHNSVDNVRVVILIFNDESVMILWGLRI